MTDYFLDFKTEETFNTVKGTSPFEYGEGGVIASSNWSVDIIGAITKVISWDEEGTPTYSDPEGWLVNLRSDEELPATLSEYQVFPVSPVRVWA